MGARQVGKSTLLNQLFEGQKDILWLNGDVDNVQDLLQIESISKPDKIVRLLKALAYQIGNQISYNEIAQLVGLDSKTVEKYIDVLEQSYIVFRLSSYARNLRNEPKQSKKIYFPSHFT